MPDFKFYIEKQVFDYITDRYYILYIRWDNKYQSQIYVISYILVK